MSVGKNLLPGWSLSPPMPFLQSYPAGALLKVVIADRGYFSKFCSTELGQTEVGSGTNAVEFVLPASSVCGRLPIPQNSDYFSVDILCLASNSIFRTCEVSCTNEFVLPFMPPGKYDIRIYSDKYGWAEVPVTVTNGISRLSSMSLQNGSTITGTTFIDWAPLPASAEVSLTDKSGFTIRSGSEFRGFNNDVYTFRNLWPGTWHLEYTLDDNLVQSTNVIIRATERVRVDFILHSE
jgi:hypothetical protein